MDGVSGVICRPNSYDQQGSTWYLGTNRYKLMAAPHIEGIIMHATNNSWHFEVAAYYQWACMFSLSFLQKESKLGIHVRLIFCPLLPSLSLHSPINTLLDCGWRRDGSICKFHGMYWSSLLEYPVYLQFHRIIVSWFMQKYQYVYIPVLRWVRTMRTRKRVTRGVHMFYGSSRSSL